MSKKIVILGGGTFSPIRNHLSLAAPAFGTTARKLEEMFSEYLTTNKTNYGEVLTYLTKMADHRSKLRTNEDISKLINIILSDNTVGTIIMNVAFCDYDANIEDRGFHGDRFKTSDGEKMLRIVPSEKIIDKIRRKRPDIFLVGFKTTTDADNNTQFLTALKMMKRSKCNLVLANDVVTRHNMIITPEESKYEAGDREAVLEDLVDMTMSRNDLTYNRTTFIEHGNIPMDEAPKSFQTVIKYLVDNGGYIENNGNNFTPGHFCYKTSENSFVSSQRKVNHNEVFDRGMTKVVVKDDKFTAYGTHKPSVGARSQWMMLNEYPEYDCIIHTHNPLKPNSIIPLASQREFQCGSLQCGTNTLNNLQDFGDIKAVMLDKHGTNILFKSTDDVNKIIEFINDNLELGVKTT